MSNDDDVSSRRLDVVPSGIPGLDAILRGGFFRGGVYLFVAPPGAGKTILGSQIRFRHVEFALVENLTELLKDEGYHVVSAANGKDALPLLLA